ncbi:bifunctional DNA primase/polymerase [Bradyrhizobium symbiodeficiens]|uniref:bifunctional DNA primase/polymerase n=1 Tax=Bradyrhizobium symbiodeficiens TaxID=1404367 RepID=UPI003BB14BBD
MHPDDSPDTPKHLRKSKRPIHSYSFHRSGTRWAASADVDFVRLMFKRDRHALVAITGGLDARDRRATWMTEPVLGSGLFFLDIDVAKPGGHSHEGAPLLAALTARLGALPNTLTSIGLDGGRHLVFRNPVGRKVVSRVLVDEKGCKLHGIDVKGEGGYVVAPPSRGRRWIDWGTPVADAPDWLLSLVCEQPRGVIESRTKRLAAGRSLVTTTGFPGRLLTLVKDAGREPSVDASDAWQTGDMELKVWCALRVIPADCDYLTWFRVGCAIYAALGEPGFTRFDDWSREAPAKYRDGSTTEKWRECGTVRAINPRTLFYLADRCDRSWRLVYRTMLAREVAR